MDIQSTMYQILDTLVPWWHLAHVTSKGESHLLGVHFGSSNNFGRVRTYRLQQKLSCLILATCVTILLFGCESWVISQDMENKINAFATSCYRVMLNIKRIDHVLNTTVYSMTKTVPLIHLVRHHQLKCLGHILRMSKEEPARRRPSTVSNSAVVDTTFVDIYVDTEDIPTCRYNIQHIDKRTMET